MGGFKTVTASEGYRFRVTRTEHILSGDRTLYCTQYTMNESGWCDFLPEEGLYSIKNPTIELVPIAEPEPEAYKTVTAGEGWEFAVKTKKGPTWHCREYSMDGNGNIDWMSENGRCSYSFSNWETIELVEVTNATSECVQGVWPKGECPVCRYKAWPEPEQDSPSVLFEMPWDEMLAVGRGGDRLQVDRNGQYWILRRCPVSDAVIANGIGRRK